MYPDISDGTVVYSRFGEKLGTVVGRDAHGFTLRHGRFRPKDFHVFPDEVTLLPNGDVVLDSDRERLQGLSSRFRWRDFCGFYDLPQTAYESYDSAVDAERRREFSRTLIRKAG